MKKTKNKAGRFSKVAQIGLIITGITFVILLCVGAWRDSIGEQCQGIAGASISCIEAYTLYPLSFIGLPIIGLLMAIIIIDYMSKKTQ
jgi:ABC-type uncharacterized transport system permease subunit